MSEPIQLMVVDLSHYDEGVDYKKLASAGIVGVIYKATQGTGYQDPTYKNAKAAALQAKLCWGSYHFGDSSDVQAQADNYLNTASPDWNELICLDYEDNGASTMTVEQAAQFVLLVEGELNRDNEMVLYSGNLIKESLGDRISAFWAARRLWLAQYSTTPVVQASWSTYWLWQYSGDGDGPQPHTVNGCNGPVDCNSFAGTVGELVEQWPSGIVSPVPPPPPAINVTVIAPPTVNIIVKQTLT